MNPFVERHQDKIAGVLSCFDRVVITGTLPDIGYAGAMAGYLGYHKIRLFDYPRWAEPLRDELRHHAEQLAIEAGIEIEFIRRHKAFRKEDRIKAIIAERGHHPGLVHIFSAMESCTAYQPWHEKNQGHTLLKPTSGKCLHYYFYFIDESFGLCYVRVPTWAPFRLQVYFNGHNWLAQRLLKAGIPFEMADNAFLSIADPTQAQTLAEQLDAKQLHRRLNRWAKQFCPVAQRFRSGYHWSFMQVEFATDVVFHQQGEFRPLYESIIRTAVQAIKADNVATFLGRKLTTTYQGEVGNDFSTRIQGTRIRHQMGPASIKLTIKPASWRVSNAPPTMPPFLIHRWVEQRDGWPQWKLAPLRKNIYSLRDLRKLMNAAVERYLAYMAAIDNPDAGLKVIDKMSSPAKDQRADSGASTCSRTRITDSFSPSVVANGPSAASGLPICAPLCPICHPASPPIYSNAYGPMD